MSEPTKRQRRRVTRFPIRINTMIEQRAKDDIERVADRFNLPEAEIMRLAIDAGLPVVERRLAREQDSD